MSDTYYFIVYEHVSKPDRSTSKGNRILKNVHPVVWAAGSGEVYNRHFSMNLLFWAEISKEIVENKNVRKMFGIEEYAGDDQD